MTKILFLDQSSKLGGAELCLADIAQYFGQSSLVAVFGEGSFPDYLRQRQVSVEILTDQTIQVRKASGSLAGLKSVNKLIPLILKTARLSQNYDVVYANTQKALVVGAIASRLSNRPLVYHLHDIVSPEHFSSVNRRLIISLANRAALVIANSEASHNAFIQSGGHAGHLHVVYNGFNLEAYEAAEQDSQQLRQQLDLSDRFVVGHFSRISPWKGQHVLIEALSQCSDNVLAMLVGDALFGEDAYVAELHHQVKQRGLQHRVKFLGFRSDIPALMSACDLVAHTSITPEPFGRVIVEAMLCGTPVIASAAGGAMELVDHGRTGWLCPPAAPTRLAELINHCVSNPAIGQSMAKMARAEARQRFHLKTTNRQISDLLQRL